MGHRACGWGRGRLRPPARVLPRPGLHPGHPGGQPHRRPAAGQHPADPRRAGQPRQPDLPRGRGRSGAGPRCHHHRDRPGPRAGRRSATGPAAHQVRGQRRHPQRHHRARLPVLRDGRLLRVVRPADHPPQAARQRQPRRPPGRWGHRSVAGHRGRVPRAARAGQFRARALRHPCRRRNQPRAGRGPECSGACAQVVAGPVRPTRRRHGSGGVVVAARPLRLRGRRAPRDARRRLHRPPQGHRPHRGAWATTALRPQGRPHQGPAGTQVQPERDLPRRPRPGLRARHDHHRCRRGIRDRVDPHRPGAGDRVLLHPAGAELVRRPRDLHRPGHCLGARCHQWQRLPHDPRQWGRHPGAAGRLQRAGHRHRLPHLGRPHGQQGDRALSRGRRGVRRDRRFRPVLHRRQDLCPRRAAPVHHLDRRVGRAHRHGGQAGRGWCRGGPALRPRQGLRLDRPVLLRDQGLCLTHHRV